MKNDGVHTFLGYIVSAFQWTSDWVIALLLIVGSALIAFALHGNIFKALRQRFGERTPYLQSFFTNAKDVTRLALAIFAVSLVLPLAPLEAEFKQAFASILAVTFVLLTGWAALIATQIASELYLKRFDFDAADNLLARKHITQVRILKRAANTMIIVIAAGVALMTFEPLREYGVSLFASAGVAGLAVALAARPVLSNLIAGLQIAMTQPIRIDDAVVVEGEWGWVEEFTSAYVVIRLWDWRRLIVPLSYFMEKPFQNWTRENAAIIGTVLIYADYTVPVERVREELTRIVKATPLWDGQVVNLQVTDAKENTVELRALVSARTSPQAWDLRCLVREKLIAFLQEQHPQALPRLRASLLNRNDLHAA